MSDARPTAGITGGLSPAGTLALRVEQTAPARARPDLNAPTMARLVQAAASDGCDVVVFPELALTGYDLGGRARDLAVDLTRPLDPELSRGTTAVLGLPERGPDHLVYNTALAARDGSIVHVHRKIYLPTYGSFDEGRIFAAGRRGVKCFQVASGWQAALLVCEDLWHPALAYLAALQGADALFVLAAAAGRGDPGPEDARRPLFASTETWELLARTVAVTHGLWVVLANRAGAEGGLSFAGDSLVVDPDGRVVARAPQGEEARLDVALDRDAVTRARDGFSHLRDEDPSLLRRELDRILREREASPS